MGSGFLIYEVADNRDLLSDLPDPLDDYVKKYQVPTRTLFCTIIKEQDAMQQKIYFCFKYLLFFCLGNKHYDSIV